jgi:hypothetical protein
VLPGILELLETLHHRRDVAQGLLTGNLRRGAEFKLTHYKVWHYFEHVRHSVGYVPLIAFSQRTRWDNGNPWSRLLSEGTKVSRPLRADILFVAGFDWLNLEAGARPRSKIPVINLLQGIRHADPVEPLYGFLSHRAIRICVSEAVANAVAATGRVNGPLHVIPNGTDLASAPRTAAWGGRSWDVVIAGVKAPEARRGASAAAFHRRPAGAPLDAGSRARRSSQRLRTAGSRCCCRPRGRVLPACHRGDAPAHW